MGFCRPWPDEDFNFTQSFDRFYVIYVMGQFSFILGFNFSKIISYSVSPLNGRRCWQRCKLCDLQTINFDWQLPMSWRQLCYWTFHSIYDLSNKTGALSPAVQGGICWRSKSSRLLERGDRGEHFYDGDLTQANWIRVTITPNFSVTQPVVVATWHPALEMGVWLSRNFSDNSKIVLLMT